MYKKVSQQLLFFKIFDTSFFIRYHKFLVTPKNMIATTMPKKRISETITNFTNPIHYC